MRFRWETEFKETEIGRIPKDWDVKRIGNIAKINEENINKNYPHKVIEYIDINSVEEGMILERKYIPLDSAPTRARRIVRDRDILLSTVRPNLRHFAFVKKANPNTIASTGFAVIRAKKAEPRFLYYYLTTEFITEYLTQIAEEHASTYPAFTPDVVENLNMPYPSPEEQIRIATVLSWFDDLIENKKRQNEILEKTAMAIFKSWFIDFEPFQDEEFVYNEELDMEIPKGWDVVKIKDIAECYDHKRIPLSELERQKMKGEYPYYGANGIIDYINDYIFDGLYLLVAEDGTVIDDNGQAVVHLVEGKFWVNNHAHVLAGKDDFPTELLYLIFKFTPIELYITGAVQPKLTQTNLMNIPVVIPPRKVLEDFTQLIKPIFQKILLNQKQILTLKKIRDTLLPQLVFGRLRVEEL